MKKKILALMIVIALAISSAFAAPLIQLGPSVSYEKQVWDGENVVLPGEELSFADFGVGADLRVNLGLMQLAAFADCGMPFGDEIDAITMSGGVSLNTVISSSDTAVISRAFSEVRSLVAEIPSAKAASASSLTLAIEEPGRISWN